MNRRRNRFGFSLIELLVVIGLIAILSTLLLIGINKLQTNSKRQQTRLAFQNLTAMYSEWDAINRHHFINYADANTGVYYVDVALPCPGNVATGGTDRTGLAVLATRDMMSMLKQMPTNAAAMGKLSAASFMTIQTTPPPATLWSTSGDPTTSFSGYWIFDRVYVLGPPNVFGTQPKYFYTAVAINWTPPSPPSTPGVPLVAQPAPPDSRFWLASTPDATDTNTTELAASLTVPVLLDGWGNPIIFVPGGILGYQPGSASGMLTAGGIQGTQVKSPDGRPFWASAGPDGDFSKGDDNLYSFEK